MKHSRNCLCAVLLAVSGTLPAFPQAITGDLVGTVFDTSGSAVANASVTALNSANGAKSNTTANAQGQYRVTNLLPGTYAVSAAAPGFAVATLQGVGVNLNQTGTANLILQVSNVSSTVEVTEASASLDTTTAQIGQTYVARQAQDLPNASIGQGVLNLSLLQGGVTSSGGLGYGTGPSVGGQRPTNNNFMIEGVDNNSKNVTGPQIFIPNDDVAEFTLLQNQFRAEYGHSSGGQFNTTVKNGTNQVHGMLYEYVRNRNLNALDQAFANQNIRTTPRYDQNRLGANVGGPLLHNKWFFFAGFEYNPLGQASTPGSAVYAPTAAGYGTLAGLPGVSATNLKVMQTYATAASVIPGAPSFVVNGVSIPTGIIPIQAPNFSNSYYGVVSSDLNISERDQLRGRFIYNRSETIDTGATLPAFFTSVPTRNYIATLNEYHTFSPTLTNEFRLGYSRQNQSFPDGGFTFPGLDKFPNLQFNDLSLQLGPNNSFPQFNVNNLYQASDAVTWIRGRHTLKAGYEFRDYIAPSSFTQRSRGDYEYTSTAAFLLDQNPDYLLQRGLGDSIFYGNTLTHYLFLQDTWRVTQKLTMDVGARYERTNPSLGQANQKLNALANVGGLIDFHTPRTQNNAVAPRIGLAYTPNANANTVIRAGFGITYDLLFDNLGINTQPPEFSTTVDLTGTPGSGFLAKGGIPPNYSVTGAGLTPAQARASTSAFVPDQVLPYALNWNFAIEHVFAKDYSIQVRYLGTRGVHLVTQQQMNVFSPVTAASQIPTYFSVPPAATLASLPLTVADLRAQGRILPQYAAAGFTSPITTYTPQGWSAYNALSVQLNKRFSSSLQFIAAYTWGHNIDNSTAVVASTYLTPRRAQDFFSLSEDKASSALDRRQRFTFSPIYDLPFAKGSGNWFLKNIVGNWEAAGVYTYESPEYFTPQSGVDSNLNGDSAPDRTVLNPSGQPGTGSGVYGLTRTGSVVPVTAARTATDAVVAWVAANPNARYVQAGYGARPNAGRNTQPTRPIDNIDLTLIKRFALGERRHLEFAGQALNLFNHAQFIPGSVNDVTIVSSFNPGTQSFTRASNPAFNNPEAAFSSNPRVLQLFAKLVW